MKEFFSNKLEPLKFFEDFIQKDSILKFENSFYNYPINPSQVKNKSQGYIEYTKDIIAKDNKERVRKYFAVELKTKLRVQSQVSLDFLKHHKKERLYMNDESDQFINLQLQKLNTLFHNSKKFPYEDVISQELQFLYSEIKKLLTVKKHNKEKPPFQSSIGNNGFFGNTSKANHKTLSKIYDVILNLELIEEVNTTEEDFINILTDTNPKILESRIFFIKDNYHSIFFLSILSGIFNDLSSTKIAKSKCFCSKKGIPFSQETMDKYKSLLKKRSSKEYQYIEDALKGII